MATRSVRIYDDNMTLLWYSANYSDIASDNTKIVPVVIGPLEWRTWSEPTVSNFPVISSGRPMEQLNITNDETNYLWYRRNVTLKRVSPTIIMTVQTRLANALLFFLDGEYLGEFDNHDHAMAGLEISIALDLSHFKTNQQYLFEILSVALGINTDVGSHGYDHKGIDGNVWLDGQLLANDEANLWEHQKGLVGEYFQIYTEEGSSKVSWDTQWTKGINKPITWFQTRFHLNNLVKKDTVANPILLDAQGLNHGHAFMNGNDIGLYWLIQGICRNSTSCCCQQAQINCLEPTQRYYHIPSDWLVPENNLLTIFDDLGAPSPGSVSLLQRVVTK